MKSIRLNRGTISKEAITQMATDTLRAGGWVEPHPAESQGGDADLGIGAVMKDGTIFAGVSPDTGKPMYAMPADVPWALPFDHAAEYAKEMGYRKAYGHDDWRLPTKGELNVLFNNRAAIGGFNISGSSPSGWYWSASPSNTLDAWCQRLSDGAQGNLHKNCHLSVRCVRSHPLKT